VTSEPDVTAVPLNGTEDFLVLACDGLWDFVSEQEAVMAVYQQIAEAPGRDMSHAKVNWGTEPFVRLLSTEISRIYAANKLAQAVMAVTPLTCIQEVPDLNLGWGHGYHY
jgi:serine/threonine protein phosphatase PrpC